MTADAWVGMLTLTLLFVLEGSMPFYAGRTDRLVHAGRNLGLALISGAVAVAATPLLMASAATARSQGIGLCHWLDLGPWASLVLVLVLFDLWMYAWHRLNHRIPLLWRLHRVHHTDIAMDSTTALRFHPGEIALSMLANCLVLVALGMSFEAFVVYKSIMVAVILFHHSNVALPEAMDRALRVAIVTPAVHRVHHSELRPETDSNYGTILSVWDRWLGSLRLRQDPEAIRFGIGSFAGANWQRPWRLLALPFVNAPAGTGRGER
jgi:sterol desaturase/sphingolipid hydroxylase (fatty acid hydroxylase superfamily)